MGWRVTDLNEVLEIVYKNKAEFFRDVKTDIFLPVLEYINENIK